MDTPEIIEGGAAYRGKMSRFLYQHADTFNDLPYKLISQCRAIAFWGNRVVIVRNGKSNTWTFPGGSVEYGETKEAALIRELKEEANVRVIDFTPIGYQEVLYANKYKHFQLRYLCNVEPYGEFKEDPDGSIVEIA